MFPRFFDNMDVRENTVVNDTIQNILINKGSLDIAKLAKEFFVSTRHLERLFHEYVGITPKKLSNLIRYQFLCRPITLITGIQEIPFQGYT